MEVDTPETGGPNFVLIGVLQDNRSVSIQRYVEWAYTYAGSKIVPTLQVPLATFAGGPTGSPKDIRPLIEAFAEELLYLLKTVYSPPLECGDISGQDAGKNLSR